MFHFIYRRRRLGTPPGASHPSGEESLGRAHLATFAAGCFWGVEAAFREIEGVLETRVGYTGGHTANPTYDAVCSHTTGHAEAVEVTFDPAQVSYERLLETFWRIHNPTTHNGQGWDIHSQYRSAIFVHDPDQAALAATSREHEQAELTNPIVTEITPAGVFYQAEDYHQQFFEKRGRAAAR
jgi:peptide-methionine (S)-S-oxide reductase